MANSAGGHIVFGIEDTSRRRGGISTEASAALRDAKTVNDKLKKYCGGGNTGVWGLEGKKGPPPGGGSVCFVFCSGAGGGVGKGQVSRGGQARLFNMCHPFG